MAKGKRPTEPVVDDNGNHLKNFAELARQLNDWFPPVDRRRPVSRQLVHKWFQYREHNRFPEAADLKNCLFDVQKVTKWYIEHRGYRIGDDLRPKDKRHTTVTTTAATRSTGRIAA